MPEAEPRERTVWTTREECPRCGSPLVTDGVHKWCSLAVGEGQTPCLYGIAKLVRVEDYPR